MKIDDIDECPDCNSGNIKIVKDGMRRWIECTDCEFSGEEKA